MTDVILERRFEQPLTPKEVQDMAAEAQGPGGCFNLFKVRWQHSFIGLDGTHMVCCFDAPDAEFARRALRQAGADVTRLWPGTVHDAPNNRLAIDDANVAVQRTFRDRVALEAIQAIEDAGAHCLELHRVQFMRTYFARDGKRMVCLYKAPDAESVRLAQTQAQVPFDHIWGCQLVSPPPA